VERDADDPADPDGDPNQRRFADAAPDVHNLDAADDGIVSATVVEGPDGEVLLRVEIGVVRRDTSADPRARVNVLFDHDADGAWNGDIATFTPDAVLDRGTLSSLLDEWGVKNATLAWLEGEPLATLTFDLPLYGVLLLAERQADALTPYLRMVVSDAPISGDAWKGQGKLDVGEVEDWRIAGVDDDPTLDCAPAPRADFAWNYEVPNAIVPLRCFVERAASSADDEDLDVTVTFDTSDLAGAAEIDCDGDIAMTTVTIPAGSRSVALPCDIDRERALGEPRRVPVSMVTGAEAEVGVFPGKNSRVELSLGRGLDSLILRDPSEDTAEDTDDPQDSDNPQDTDDLQDTDDPQDTDSPPPATPCNRPDFSEPANNLPAGAMDVTFGEIYSGGYHSPTSVLLPAGDTDVYTFSHRLYRCKITEVEIVFGNGFFYNASTGTYGTNGTLAPAGPIALTLDNVTRNTTVTRTLTSTTTTVRLPLNTPTFTADRYNLTITNQGNTCLDGQLLTFTHNNCP
jgi:hypothetical protein